MSHLTRRNLLKRMACIIAAVSPITARAQKKIWRIGYLALTKKDTFYDALINGLAELGYNEGAQYVIEARINAENEVRLASFAKELTAIPVDIIVARGTQATQQAMHLTKSIPIVMTGSSDPVGSGLVQSLARPGGNVTGMSIIATDVSEKKLQLVKRIVPKATRIAVFWNPANGGNVEELKRVRSGVEKLGLQVVAIEIRQSSDVSAAFAKLMTARADALMTLADSVLVGARKAIVDLATANKVPGMFHLSDFVEVGGLASYGPDLHESFRRAASYVHHIIGGKRPAELPVQQATAVELVINLKTARLLGLVIPDDVVVQAKYIN